MRRMCSSSVSWYAIVACVILFLSILASIQCLPLDNSPAAAMLHRKSSLMNQDADSEVAADLHNYHHGSMGTRTSTHNFYWWQIVERASGVQEVESLDREKRFPRIPIGEVCRTHRQCSNTHCCAMKLGMPVCRRRPLTGQPCQLSSSKDIRPDTSQLFTYCPCANGLRCQRSRSRHHPMNTRCSADNDCESTHCCAMKLGQPVCRRRPVLEERCQDWTPLDTNALFSLCPCAEGFQCRRIPRRNVGVCEATRR